MTRKNTIYLELAVKEALNKGADVVSVELRVGRLVLGHILLQADKTHSGNFRFLHAEEVQDTVMVLLISVDGNEQKLFPEVLGNSAGALQVLVEVSGFLGQEHKEVGLDFTTEDLLGSFVVELNNQGQGVRGNKLLQDVFLEFTFKVSTALIELKKY